MITFAKINTVQRWVTLTYVTDTRKCYSHL